jgi:predicted nuclease with RNAse H fold
MQNTKKEKLIPFTAGVDFGSKMAGTTAIAWLDENGKLHTLQSEKNKDADAFLIDCIMLNKIKQVGLDAPLSLPKGLYDLENNLNCFYRDSDRELGAMSPMFLGGLTARAIQLKKTLKREAIIVSETYPAAFVKNQNIKKHYNKKNAKSMAEFSAALQQIIPFQLPQTKSWHILDACICLIIALNIEWGKANFTGDADERIWF